MTLQVSPLLQDDLALVSVRSVNPIDQRFNPDFNSLLLDCIDETFSDLFGSRIREAVYDNLARTRSLARDEVPNHLDLFFDLLEQVWGKGSKTIGRRIAKKIYSKLGLEFVDIPNFEFADYFQAGQMALNRQFERRGKVSEFT